MLQLLTYIVKQEFNEPGGCNVMKELPHYERLSPHVPCQGKAHSAKIYQYASTRLSTSSSVATPALQASYYITHNIAYL